MKAGSFFTLALLLCSFSSFAQTLSIQVHEFTNPSEADSQRVERALFLLEDIVNDEDFRQQALNMSYKIGSTTYTGFTQTELSAEEVLNSIFEAKENFDEGSAGVMDLFMDMYYARSSTIGYTSQRDKFFHMNRYHHQNYSPAQTVGNIFHEWLHKIGHGHSKRNNTYRPHSVPYKLGNLIAKMAAERDSHGDPVLKSMFMQEFNEGMNQDCQH